MFLRMQFLWGFFSLFWFSLKQILGLKRKCLCNHRLLVYIVFEYYKHVHSKATFYILWSKMLNRSDFKQKKYWKKWGLNWNDTIKNTRDGNFFSTVAGMRASSFTEKELNHRYFVKFGKFTEHHFCRRLPGDCFWFPATFWTYPLLY